MPVKKKDTDRALVLLEEYCKKLRKPEEQQLKKAIKKVMGIFKSSLFQALLDIQEFYEVTLLNSQKSYEQKIEEANQVAEKWEKTTSATDHEKLQKKQESAASNGSEGSGQCGEHHKENQTFENYVVDLQTKASAVGLVPTSLKIGAAWTFSLRQHSSLLIMALWDSRND